MEDQLLKVREKADPQELQEEVILASALHILLRDALHVSSYSRTAYGLVDGWFALLSLFI